MCTFAPTIAVKGAGEMASGVAASLYRAGFHRIVMFDMSPPLAVRLYVAFCQALMTDKHKVEDIYAHLVSDKKEIAKAWTDGVIAVCDDPLWHLLDQVQPDILIDATIAKKNLGTRIYDASFVVGVGPGFTAGEDVHVVVETQRGHNLGKLYYEGAAATNTGTPEAVLGYTHERVLRAPCDGIARPLKKIGQTVQKGEIILEVSGEPVMANISGILRGCINSGVTVLERCKIGDIDPRGDASYCFSISDKARCLGGAALTAVTKWLMTQQASH